MNSKLESVAIKNIRDILAYSIKYDSTKNNAVVIFDTAYELTNILTSAYKKAIPQAAFINFNSLNQQEIIDIFKTLSPEDLVVLIQSGSFRLNKYRIRLNLFNQGLKVVEHMHLHRNPPQTWKSYVDSLAYDQEWYEVAGAYLQKELAKTESLKIVSTNGKTDTTLEVQGELEIPKLNTGNYTNMKNAGGTFPIGEVFTEAKDLRSVNGSFFVYAHADENFEIIFPEVFRVDVCEGLVTGWSDNASPEFVKVIENIERIERPIIREIGFGLNRGIHKDDPVRDITAFERVVGVHLSLGEKHNVYAKTGIKKHKARFHVDLFLNTTQVYTTSGSLYTNGEYTLN